MENKTTEAGPPAMNDVTQKATEGDVPSGDTFDPSIATAPAETSATAGPGVTTAAVTDALLVAYFNTNDPLIIQLKAKFESLLNDLNFLQDDPWIQHAIDGLKKSDHTERLGKQGEKTVTKTLLNEAYQNAKPGESITPPTKEKIAAGVNKMMDERRKKIQQAKDFKIAKAKAAILAAK